ncbi:hypothetical protein ACFVW1_14145 [Streptomyces olivochromogenes]|uniref:hypothetical protein n=1 Tax=Streptomyces olivochromogenes TaxID=1963 RepID=UPI0036DEC2C9
MVARRAGDAWLVHPLGELDKRSWMFATGLARDPELTLVVIDIPEGADWAILHEVARALPLGDEGLRLVFGRTPPGGAAVAGQWLASRLKRVVMTAIGRPWPTSDGALFVSSDRGPGWMRYDPAGGESWEAWRFPKPVWEKDLHGWPRPLTERTSAEPIAAGVWLRPAEETPESRRHRAFLIARLRSREDSITVAVGTPGAVAIPLNDITRFWRTLPKHARPTTRFVRFGPVELPSGQRFEEALAESVGAPVRLYNGLPTNSSNGTPAAGRPVLLMRDDGTPGRPVMAREVIQLPRRQSEDRQLPMVADHGWPIGSLPLVSLGTYRYGLNTVIEVIPSGLWIRGAREPAHGHDVRSTPVNDRHELVLYDGSDTQALPGLRQLAEEIAQQVTSENSEPVEVVTVQVPHEQDQLPTRRDEFPLPTQPAVPEPAATAAEIPADVRTTSTAEWLYATFGRRYDESTAFVAELLRQQPALHRGQSPNDAVHDLAALRLYLLTEGLALDEAEPKDDQPGAAIARSLTEGLRRLPVFKGPATLRVSLSEAEVAWYAAQRTITEEGSFAATFSGSPGRRGNTDILILSTEGRRTALLESSDPDWVLFLPGARFAVLRVEPGNRNVVLLRELAQNEDANSDANPTALQQLRRALLDWQKDESAGIHRSSAPGLLFRPPGLSDDAAD